ncbi:hypothetical protein SAMN04489730_6317 [Amycolatopsis australiensis]|uniref:Uncharacterized protein n=1 Tax=Amycolatopsis australiensis TaxID=546364 RepID=A0A1K1SPZ5_9PSEU|nr:hypothetical protein SAMN04489730_6317 [Amycolatopsis australiensis]
MTDLPAARAGEAPGRTRVRASRSYLSFTNATAFSPTDVLFK